MTKLTKNETKTTKLNKSNNEWQMPTTFSIYVHSRSWEWGQSLNSDEYKYRVINNPTLSLCLYLLPSFSAVKVPLIRQFAIPPSTVDNRSKSPQKVNHPHKPSFILQMVQSKMVWGQTNSLLSFRFSPGEGYVPQCVTFPGNALWEYSIYLWLENSGETETKKKHVLEVKHKSLCNFRRYECMNINTNPGSKGTKWNT